MAFIRSLARRQTTKLGNFWVDLTRGILYILLPMSIILALLLVSQGVVQTLSPYKQVTLLQTSTYQQPSLDASGNPVTDSQGNPVMETVPLNDASSGSWSSRFPDCYQAVGNQRRRLF